MAITTATAPAPTLLTADEFDRLPVGDERAELVEGVVVRYPMAGTEHGYIGNNASFLITAFVREHGLGWVMGLDTYIRVKRDPDTVRGADVCFLSYAKWPKDKRLPKGRLEVMPELVVEVRSPSDRWGDIQIKVGEYLNAGVGVVVVLDPATASASAHRQDELHQLLHNGDELTLPDVLPGFAARVAAFFA